MNELARMLLAAMRSHHYGTPLEMEMRRMPAEIHPSWHVIAQQNYEGFCEAIGEKPRFEEPKLRIIEGGR